MKVFTKDGIQDVQDADIESTIESAILKDSSIVLESDNLKIREMVFGNDEE